jgi:DnaJ-class molecular chaperone
MTLDQKGLENSSYIMRRHTQMKAYPDCNGDRVKTCPDCNGDGVVDKDADDERQCPTCGGLGFVPDDDDHEEVIKTSRVALSVTNVGGKP